MSRSRNWCYTLNNYAEADYEALKEVVADYHVCGQEVGASGTPHLQGFIRFKSACTLEAAKKKLHPRMHLEAAKGTVEQAADYCKKEATVFFELGKQPMSQEEQGRIGGEMEKKRWETALEEARTTGEVSDPQIAFCHARTVDYLHLKAEMKKPRVDTEQENLWYWGDTGTGKSRKAREENPDAYLKMCNKWWDGYRDEDVVLIEDWDHRHEMLVHHLKIWADRYPFLCEGKGVSRKVRPGKLIVTSNYHPRDIWPKDEDVEPILRRFKCVEFKALAMPPPSTPPTQLLDE